MAAFAILKSVQIDLRENLKDIQSRIGEAARRAGRGPGEIKLVAVSKTHPVEVLQEALDAGVNVFGENKVQEAEPKIIQIGRDAAEWHLIGHLQSNKARKTVQLFDCVHSIDSVELAQRLERICKEEERSQLSVFAEVDLAGEKTKSGVAENDLPRIVEFLKKCERLKFDGLMIIPPFYDDPEATRPYFKKLRELRDRLLLENAFANGRGELSMGMSSDFEVAIEEGATIVRVGTSIFGERSYAN